MPRTALTAPESLLPPDAGEARAGLAALRELRRELALAREVQARLLPRSGPRMATLAYAGECVPAREVGGDYYDFLSHRPGRLAVALGDVAGKGIAAALLMASLQAHLRSQWSTAERDLGSFLEAVNVQFCRSIGASRFATLFFGRYDDAARRLRYVNCGHLPPILLRADGSVRRLATTGTVVGAFPAWEGTAREISLGPGDTLVAFTDGLTEAVDGDGREFGEERLVEAIRICRGLGPAQLCRALLRAVHRFAAGRQSDDRTVVALQAARAGPRRAAGPGDAR